MFETKWKYAWSTCLFVYFIYIVWFEVTANKLELLRLGSFTHRFWERTKSVYYYKENKFGVSVTIFKLLN